jgi:hypothetical protein
MTWFDKWLARKVRRGLEQQKAQEEERAINSITRDAKFHLSKGIPIQVDSSGLDSFPDLNFRMYKANNGWVMEVRHNDKRTDRQSISMHIIPEGEDLGDHIAKIITYESLKT